MQLNSIKLKRKQFNKMQGNASNVDILQFDENVSDYCKVEDTKLTKSKTVRTCNY